MLNTGKNFALCATKKIYSNSRVVRKKISEQKKTTPELTEGGGGLAVPRPLAY